MNSCLNCYYRAYPKESPRCLTCLAINNDVEPLPLWTDQKPKQTNGDKIRKKAFVVDVNNLDFGTVCVCALRYAMGRETYMPSLVRDYVRPLLPHLPDSTISVMVQDCEFQARYGNYGHDQIDKPGWIRWEQEVRAEMKRREHDE